MLPVSQDSALSFALKVREDRKNWDNLFERLAQMFLPRGSGFDSENTAGEDLFDHLNSSAPVLARRGLSAATNTMMRPAGRRWFHGKAKVNILSADPGVRIWLEQVSKIMHDMIYDPRAKMEPNLAMCDDELVTFGNACCRVGWDRKAGHLKYQARPMKSTYFVRDAAREVVGVISFEKWALRQIVERFGENKLSEEMSKELKNKKPNMDREFELVHIVLPVIDARALGMPFKQDFSSLWMSVKCKKTLEIKGYDFLPYLTPQWDKSTGELYARGPAAVALGDAQLYQQVTETFINAGEKALNPPTWGYGDLINGEYDLTAGGFTSVDMAAALGNQAPVNPVQLGTLPTQIVEYLGMLEERIGMAFSRDVLELPSARDADLTATEINARLDQYMRQAAPVFGRIESNYNAPHIEMVYQIGTMEGMFPPKPEVMAEMEAMTGEQGIDFEYESPIKVAREKSEAMKIVEGIGIIGSAAATFGDQAVGAVAQNFEPDAIARNLGPKLDLPEWVYKPLDQMMEEPISSKPASAACGTSPPTCAAADIAGAADFAISAMAICSAFLACAARSSII